MAAVDWLAVTWPNENFGHTKIMQSGAYAEHKQYDPI